ncbi:hypothetical protein [Marinithermofilum abyssi]|uniref:hypothetical protein n=1 Tax=Marinithermofilum abyssi TaxID=1571185 RepID=UPI001664C288|nr:hypothetical protein [Marinithermofilum abyssi]
MAEKCGCQSPVNQFDGAAFSGSFPFQPMAWPFPTEYPPLSGWMPATYHGWHGPALAGQYPWTGATHGYMTPQVSGWPYSHLTVPVWSAGSYPAYPSYSAQAGPGSAWDASHHFEGTLSQHSQTSASRRPLWESPESPESPWLHQQEEGDGG